MSYMAHRMVGECEMDLGQLSNALPHIEAALRWKQMQVDQEPSNARWARDWGGIHSLLGTAQIALGRFDEGMTNLQESVRIAESVLAHDPMNGSEQLQVIRCLQHQAEGLAKIARAPETSPKRREELWQQAVQALTHCQARLTSPAVVKLRIQNSKTSSQIAQELEEARAALAKVASAGRSKGPKP
jgi:tetratricopeptide (TPR) repeat protein